MSGVPRQIPRPGGGIPMRKVTKTVKSSTPLEESVTTTVTTSRMPQPSGGAGGGSRLQAPGQLRRPSGVPQGIPRHGGGPSTKTTTSTTSVQEEEGHRTVKTSTTIRTGGGVQPPGGGRAATAGASGMRAPSNISRMRPASAMPPPGGAGMQSSRMAPPGGGGGMRPPQQQMAGPSAGGKTIKTISSKTTVGPTGAKKTKTTTKTVSEKPVEAPQYPRLQEGAYFWPMDKKPHDKAARFQQFCSPMGLRSDLDEHMPAGLKGKVILPKPGDVHDYRPMMKHPAMKDVITGNLRVYNVGKIDPNSSYDPDRSQMNYGIDSMAAANISGSPGSPLRRSELEEEVHSRLLAEAKKKMKTPLKATGTKTSRVSPQIVMTPEGPMEATQQIISERTVERTPNSELVSKHIVAIEGDVMTELETQRLSPGRGLRSPTSPDSKEVISISSNVTIAGGIKQTTKKVMYDTTEDPDGEGTDPGPDPAMVSQLIQEESFDVDKTKLLHAPTLKHSSPLTYGIKKRVQELQLNTTDVSMLEQSIVYPSPRADEAHDEPPPELLASIMYTTEYGIPMACAPSLMYDALFGGAGSPGEAATMAVNSAAPAPLQDVIVPLDQYTESLHIPAMNPELVMAANAMLNSPVRPSDGGWAERMLNTSANASLSGGSMDGSYVASDSPKVRNVARKKKSPKKLTDIPTLAGEIPPWGIEDLQPVLDIFGAKPTSVLEALDATADPDVPKDFSEGIDYVLTLHTTSHQSSFQLRGSQKPSWFPGYIMCLPNRGETLSLARSPSAVLHAAYKAVQPDIFQDDNFVVA